MPRPPGETQCNRHQSSGRFKLSACGRGGRGAALLVLRSLMKSALQRWAPKQTAKPPRDAERHHQHQHRHHYTLPSSLMVPVESNWFRLQTKRALFYFYFGSRSEETAARARLIIRLRIRTQSHRSHNSGERMIICKSHRHCRSHGYNLPFSSWQAFQVFGLLSFKDCVVVFFVPSGCAQLPHAEAKSQLVGCGCL